MMRLYHSLRLLFRLPREHKKTTFAIFFLILFLFIISPALPYLRQTAEIAKGFFFSSTATLAQDNNRTNFVILGVDRRSDGVGGLTDSILFFSFDHAGKNHLLLSLPRDIWIPEIRAKINTAYYYGNLQDGLGIEWVKKYVSQIVGQPIHHSTVLSFDGFVEIIDFIGSVDIEVTEAFSDNKYPISGRENDDCGGDITLACRWETISFEKGKQKMSGEQALKFARSRHAEGTEGTDFARSARQQKVMLALKNKFLSPMFFLNPALVSGTIETVTGNIETDVSQADLGSLLRAFLQLKKEEIDSRVLNGVYDQEDEPTLLANPPRSPVFDNQWVIVPKSGDWNMVHSWVECLLDGRECPVSDFTEK